MDEENKKIEDENKKEDITEKISETEEIDYSKMVEKRRKREKVIGITAIVCLASILGGSAIGFCFGVGSSLVNKFFSFSDNTIEKHFSFSTDSTEDSTETTLAPQEENKNDSVSIINNVAKSVVAINTVSTEVSNEFFGLPIQQNGSGSGVIFHEDDKNIYIVTNYHVISGAESVKITIENSAELSAKLVGKNFASDIAVISVDKEQLKNVGVNNVTIASFGDSDKIRIGEKITAIGNALGEGSTVTSGIISAKNKKINVDGKNLSVIQIDASINPGNSGGALIDETGKVIGITTAKYAKFTVEGMAFCIASNDVKPVIEELMNKKDKPYLGITGIDLTQEIADNYGLPNLGIFINSVVKGSNAEKYGLQRGDIITMFNGKTVYTTEDLYKLVKQCKIGDEIELHIIRNGTQKMNIKIKMDEFHDSHF